jgi:hypothetical protein
VIINCISIYAIFPEELLHYVIFSMLSVNYPLFNCVSKTLLKGTFWGDYKKNGEKSFWGVKKY